MSAWIRSKLSFANVVSMMALFIALSGIAWAASLPRDSVGAAQIKKDAVGASEIKKDAVSRSEVKRGAVSTDELKDGGVGAIDVTDGSLAGAEIADGTLALADLGPNSVDGSKVVEGSIGGGDVADGSLGGGDVAAGTFLGGKVTVQFTQAAADLADGAEASYDVHCPEGQTALGGGQRGDATDSEDTQVGSSRPIISTTNSGAPIDDGTFTGWRTSVLNPTGGTTTGLRPEVWVICAALP